MMKKRRLSMLLISISCIVLLISMSDVAFGNDFDPQVPAKMKAGTVIVFDSECEMHILKQGNNSKIQEIAYDLNFNNEDTSGLEEEEKLISEIRQEAKNLPHFSMSPKISAKPNTMVVYASDGKIHRILNISAETLSAYAPEVLESLGAGLYSYEDALDYYGPYHPFPRGKREAPGVYDLGYRNKITIASHHVLGEGRLSTFGELSSDNIGENGTSDPNKTGDCATRGEIDNAPYHQMIRVRNLDNDIVKDLRKNDNGKLPFAVLDIYKWDGVYFGETWYNGFTFENGRYYYEF